MNEIISGAVAEALGGIAAEAVKPLLDHASRAVRNRYSSHRTDFYQAYKALLVAKTEEIKRTEEYSVLSLFEAVPAGLSLSQVKRRLNTPTALGFVRQLTAINILGGMGDFARNRSAQRY